MPNGISNPSVPAKHNGGQQRQTLLAANVFHPLISPFPTAAGCRSPFLFRR
ncbi:MAG: hypothetical protein IPM61_04725 [Chlorobi bacterium]|nr:hypothetical protein [Chlorobiota bacterium]MBX7216187.1 hypothetical protein [Candidatus Kapabacteria bacterium]